MSSRRFQPKSGGRWSGICGEWGFGALGIAFDAAGAFPGVEFLGLEFVDVGHDGIEDVHLGIDEGELAVDEGGIFSAFLDLGAVVLVDIVQCSKVVAEIGDKGRVDADGEEAGAEGGFGGELGRGVAANGGGIVFQQHQEAIGVDADVFLDAGRDVVEGNGESEFSIACLDGAGGAGDAFESEQ